MRYTPFCLFVCCLLTLSMSTGCRSPYRADQGAALGGIGGAVLGGIVGKQLGNTTAGAAIGGFSGLVAGGAIGQELDNIEAQNRAQIESQLGRQIAAGAVPIEDVIAMSKAGVDDSLIITQLRTKGFQGNLYSKDIIMLKEQGVSSKVINTMQTANAPKPRKVVPASTRPVIIEEHYHSSPFYHHRRHHHRHHPRGAGWGISYQHR